MKKLWLVIFILVLVVVAYMLWQSKTSAPAEVSDVDTTQAINQDLNSLNTADLDKEFKDIDIDLNTL